MRKIILKWLVNTLALLVTTYFVKGIHIRGVSSLILAAALLGILNALIRPILLILTFPITIITLGLFTLIINGAMLWFVSLMIKGFVIQGFWPAIIGALIVSLVSWLFNWLIR